MHQLLTKRGVQNGLKANLRAQILRAARSDGFLPDRLQTDALTMDDKIAVSLIAQFLARKSMDLTRVKKFKIILNYYF